MTHTTVNTKFADDSLEDMLMQCGTRALAVVTAWGHHPASLVWSRRLSRWLIDSCQCERDRREMKTTVFPTLSIVNDWTNPELVGALGLACSLCDAAIDPMTEQIARKLRNAMIATATGRLLDADDANKNTGDNSCDAT